MLNLRSVDHHLLIDGEGCRHGAIDTPGLQGPQQEEDSEGLETAHQL